MNADSITSRYSYQLLEQKPLTQEQQRKILAAYQDQRLKLTDAEARQVRVERITRKLVDEKAHLQAQCDATVEEIRTRNERIQKMIAAYDKKAEMYRYAKQYLQQYEQRVADLVGSSADQEHFTTISSDPRSLEAARRRIVLLEAQNAKLMFLMNEYCASLPSKQPKYPASPNTRSTHRVLLGEARQQLANAYYFYVAEQKRKVYLSVRIY